MISKKSRDKIKAFQNVTKLSTLQLYKCQISSQKYKYEHWSECIIEKKQMFVRKTFLNIFRMHLKKKTKYKVECLKIALRENIFL